MGILRQNNHPEMVELRLEVDGRAFKAAVDKLRVSMKRNVDNIIRATVKAKLPEVRRKMLKGMPRWEDFGNDNGSQ